MAKILTFFNHKGGVGKTTLAYNVAWGLSNKGKRVLMIDADAQCNLTEISVDDARLYETGSDFFFKNNIHRYFSSYILPDLSQGLLKPEIFERRENLFLLAGSIEFAELEETVALSIAGITPLKNVPNLAYKALQDISVDFDYTIIDLSPALSATNHLLLMLSDYFIIPVNPSIFSEQALRNINSIFRTWNRSLSGFEVFSRKIKTLPRMLGIVCQNYRPYSKAEEKNTKSAMRFEQSMEQLNEIASLLATDLNAFGMALTPVEFDEIFKDSKPYRIADIPDYNQLKVISESEKIPVSALDGSILNKYKLNTKQYKEKLIGFSKECEKIINGLLKI